MNKYNKMRNKKLNIELICWGVIIVSLVVAVIIKSTATLKDYLYGNIQIDWIATKEIIFNLCMGLIASSIVALFIETSNRSMLHNRNIIIKKAVMRKFANLVNRTLWELASGTDRDMLSVTHNFHHLKELIDNRVTEFKKYCDDFLVNYIGIFTEQEIFLLNKIKSQCEYIIYLDHETWRKHVKLYEKQLERYYSSKKYKDMPLGEYPGDEIVITKLNELDNIVFEHKKHIEPLVEQLTDLKNLTLDVLED